VSLYTPQIGEVSEERLRPVDRERVVSDLRALRVKYRKLALPTGLLDVYANPPESPDECIFAKTTTTISADLTTRITPCQFGGAPDCSNCGCIASAGPGRGRTASSVRLHPDRPHFQRVAETRRSRERLRPAEEHAA
jgi:hypothetical protein